MKFAVKVFLITVIIVALCSTWAGYLLIDSVFDSSIEAETESAIEKNRLLSFALVTAAANIPASYDILPDQVICEIAETLEEAYLNSALYVAINYSDGEPIYAIGRNVFSDTELNDVPDSGMLSYKMIHTDEGAYIQVLSITELPGREVIMETQTDIGNAFEQRDDAYSSYRILIICAIAITAILMLLISFWLTRPIRELIRTARHIERGDLKSRAVIYGNDEIAQLTKSFNSMADSLEEQIHKLENEARAKEDFIASFAHELKTPLTSIIGYSDMLRSRDMDERDRFTAANYIFKEGRRLESLSLKLMDMIVLRRTEPELKRVNGRVFLSEVAGIVQPSLRQNGIKLKVRSEASSVWMEPDLMKTLVINLLDNARKASEEGSRIELYGQSENGHYDIIVRDYGRGIPQNELDKITEAFYMVDKSRSRAQNGAGLGLAICAEIASLHNTSLEFKSEVGQGTAVRIRLKGGEPL